MKEVKRTPLLTSIACLFLLFIFLPLLVYGAVPQYISYQGKLLEDGKAITGDRTITFSIWGSDTGGDPASALWQETQIVRTTDGIYNVELGVVTPLPGDLYTNDDLFLQLDIVHPTEGSQRLSPLMPFNSTVFALKAANADQATSADTSTSATNADYATNAGTATSADTATNATNATNADYAASAGTAATATNADYATSAGAATSATNADYATSAGTATSATSAASAGYATSAGNADTVDGQHASAFFTKDDSDSRFVNISGDTMSGALSVPSLQIDGATAFIADGSNTFLGLGAGDSNTTGNFNTFLGRNAGSANTTGYGNTFLGGNAGSDNTEGHGNTFLGYIAGISNTTGNNNAFLGTSSGYSNTTGSNNTFIGFDVGTYNNTGSDNTFLGYHSGYYNTTGGRNTFLGQDAGYSNTEAYDNTFLGWAAGRSNTTGHTNTFLGRSAGQYNTTGNNNTFVGYYAGISNTTGYFNTFLGMSSGYSNTTGYNNTFVGINAGRSNSTGWGNVFIGYQAGYNETASNKLYIDSSNTSSPLIYGEFDNDILVFNGNVGIGTTPAEKLTVEGAGSNPIIKGTNTDTGNFGYFASSVHGVYGRHSSSGNSGFLASSDYGVYGRNNSSGNYGFLGSENFGGVHGYSTQSVGVYGLSTNGNGVAGSSTTNGTGVYGSSVNGKGVVGYGGSYDFYASGPGENYGSASSIRWKKNIREIDNALGKIMKIRGVYFDWDEEHGGDHDMGFIAEEVGEYIPEIVSYEEDSIYATGMDYGAITPVLLQAIKELSEQNKELRAEIEALKEQYGKLNMALAEKLNWTVSKDRVSSDYQLKAELIQ